jgi:hypothetical protein
MGDPQAVDGWNLPRNARESAGGGWLNSTWPRFLGLSTRFIVQLFQCIQNVANIHPDRPENIATKA